MQIVWTEQAISDLSEIEDHIAQNKPRAAKRVANHLLGSVEHLAEFPHLGKPAGLERQASSSRLTSLPIA